MEEDHLEKLCLSRGVSEENIDEIAEEYVKHIRSLQEKLKKSLKANGINCKSSVDINMIKNEVVAKLTKMVKEGKIQRE